MSAPRRIFANLDCEDEWAGRPGARGKARRQAAVLGTLLRAAAEEGDRLWTVAPIDPALVRDVPGLCRPVLESGPPERLPSSAASLAWGATRQSSSRDHHALPRATEIDKTRRLHQVLWDFPPARPAVAARVNRRDFCLEIARSLAISLPGAEWITTIADLGRAAAVFEGRFVLKGALSAASRERLLLDRAELKTPAQAARVEALLARNGALLAEPWLDRTDDFGALALVDDRAVHPIGTHRQLVGTPLGRFRGIEVARGTRDHPDLFVAERQRLDDVIVHVGERLRAAGYRGPFGVDAWRYRTADGGLLWNPLGEINARLTMGFVARLLIDRIPRSALPGARVSLRVGAARDRAGLGLPLVEDAPDGAVAWVQSE